MKLPTTPPIYLDHHATTPVDPRVAAVGHTTPVRRVPGGYEGCEQLVGAETEALLAQLHAAPEVPVAPHSDGPQFMAVVRRALARASYDEALLDERRKG
jgi:hypothetical protein